MGRRITVDNHPQREKIVKALIANKRSYQAIADTFDIPRSTLSSYVKLRLLPAVAIEQEKTQNREGTAFLDRVEQTMVRVQKMYDACDEWLSDPENPTKYNLDPRAHEYKVIYLEPEVEGESRTRNKCSLQQLLDRIESTDRKVLTVEAKTYDTRKLLLDTAVTLNKQLELLAKIQGLVKDNINIVQNPENLYLNMIQIVNTATINNPEIKERIIGELEKASAAITG